ncbi:MAG: lipopolysaccharide biosynthesis protein [Ruthenibacterium lactatiformans]
MKLERSKNAVRNTAYGLINKIVAIVFPFVVRTVFIKTLGSEFLGLNSLFSSILTVLNLTELGFSSAVVFCMYKPIAEDDAYSINALLLFYKRVYAVIGLIIFVIGLALIPFIPHLINGTYPTAINLTVVYLVYLFNTVLSYFMYAYLQALISAFQREDVISKVNVIVQSAMYILQIIVLLTTKNYYAYLLIMPAFTVANNIRTAVIAKKLFPDYRPAGRLSKKYKALIKEKVSGLVINKVCIVSRNAFDSIFISMFLGLTETAIYNNYYYVMNAVILITSVFVNAVVSGAGNSVEMDTVEKNYCDMNRINFLYMWVAGWFTICMLNLYQPFMQLWVGADLMYPMGCVVLLCLYFYILKMSDVRYIYELAIGLWWENRFRSIAEAVANLALNYLLGKLFGVYGIIIATIVSIFFINYLYGTKIIFKYYFKEQSIKAYFKTQSLYGLVTILICGITFLACYRIKYSISGFVMRVAVCIFLPNLLYYVVYHKTQTYNQVIKWIMPKIKAVIRIR